MLPLRFRLGSAATVALAAKGLRRVERVGMRLLADGGPRERWERVRAATGVTGIMVLTRNFALKVSRVWAVSRGWLEARGAPRRDSQKETVIINKDKTGGEDGDDGQLRCRTEDGAATSNKQQQQRWVELVEAGVYSKTDLFIYFRTLFPGGAE